MDHELSPLDISEEPEAQRHPPHPRGETAWVFALAHGLLLTSGGLYWTFRGRFFDPKIYDAVGGTSWALMEAFDADVLQLVSVGVRLAGTLAVAAGLLVMAVSATAFRRHERWSWYALLGLPFYVTLDLMTLAGYRALSPTSLVWDGSLLITAVFALTTPYRLFFPETPSTPTTSSTLARDAREAPPLGRDRGPEERHA
jgi:hypothetical protein